MSPPWKGRSMKIRIIRSTVCDGKVVEAGQVVEASDKSADVLIKMGKAVQVNDAERTVEAPEKAVLPRGQKRSKDAEGNHTTSG